MDRKTITNAGAGAIFGFATFASLLPAIFKAVGWIEWAQGLSGVVALFMDPRISWAGIYLLLGFFAAAVLLANNWNQLKAWQRRRARERTRAWDFLFEDAIAYVGYGTYFADSLARDTDTRLKEAGAALIEAARKGRVFLGGCSDESLTVKRIPPRRLKHSQLDFRTGTAMGGYYVAAFDTKLVSAEDANRVLYRKLFFDRDEVKRVWPPKPDRVV